MPSHSHGHAFAMAVAAAIAIAMLLIVAVIFFYFKKFACSWRYRHRHRVAASFRREAGFENEDIRKVDDNVKVLLAEENGIDIQYMVETQGRHFKTSFPTRIFNPSYEDHEGEEEEEEKRIDVMVQRSMHYETQEVPLLCESPGSGLMVHEDLVKPVEPPSPSPPPPPPPPPPPSPPRNKIPKVSPVPSSPIMNRESGASAQKSSCFISSSKPPPPPKGKANMENNTSEVAGSREKKGASQTRLRPLHWDKVVANVDHSTVWDHINDGSFRFNDELIETLFGYSTNNQANERNICHASSAQIFLVDRRKSQNTSIVLRSLEISRKEIMDAVLDGQGLSLETLEKLTKIAPTQEEEAKIIEFSGNPDKLAHAESFLYCILKAVPTAFVRLKAMLFRSNYDCEAVQLKENLQTLEKGCKEMRSSGLLLKFLEAILKAGNRMNAGTSRGNAQGFNLSALRKLPDVKSIDGKTSLLHFIVEQVAQSEGRREAMNQKHNIPKINGDISNFNATRSDNDNSNNNLVQHETEKEYLILGLQVLLGGIKDQLSEVKKAATIDHQNFISMFYTLNAHVSEIREIVTKCCGDNKGGGFAMEMKGFVEECEEELKVVKEEHLRIMELVKKTNEYYLGGGGGSNDNNNMSNPFELFLIVRDFVDMVDEVCSDLRRKIEKKNVGGVGEGASTTPPLSTPLRFPKFDLHFLSNMSSATSCSSLSDDDF